MPELIKSKYAIGTEYLVQETEENQIGLKPFNPIAIPVSQNLLFKAILVVSSNVDPSYTNIEGGISGTISTLNIEPTLGNGFNLFTGDKVLLKTTIEDIYELTLTAHFVYGVNTSISFVPFISYSTIENGSIILASQSDQFNEGNRKTRGQVAGFTISPSTITKNGIGISSWSNDPTFNEVDNTTLPTSQAVKEYVLSKKDIIETKLIKVNDDVINKSAFLHDDGLRFTRISDGAETGQINYDGVAKLTLNSNGGSSTGATRLDFQVNSGSKMVIDNEGDVGIGTTNPQSKLQVGDGTDAAATRVYYSDNTYAELLGYGMEFSRTSSYLRPTTDNSKSLYIGNSSRQWYNIGMDASTITFNTNGSENMRIKFDGNVGIGTNSPGSKLHIHGTTGEILRLTNNNAVTEETSIFFGHQTARKVAIISKGVNSWYRQDLHFAVNIAGDASSATISDSKMVINGLTGNVGIGTTSPGYKLDVSGTFGADTFASIQGVDTGNPTPAADETRVSGYGIIGNRPAYYITNANAGSLIFGVGGAHAAATKMTILNSGNVGIGTTSPKNKLDIVGSLGRGIPVTKTANFTVAATENWLIVNGLATITITLPTASSFTGRELMIKNIAAYTVISASSNVKPIDTNTAATAILPAIAGSWCALVSDGSDWVTMMNG